MTEANGSAGREAALAMLDRRLSQQRRTLAADKARDTLLRLPKRLVGRGVAPA